jgi:isoleucyl-tRNA synthetase/bisphosphoglycerate-dependent phosphoglycerate mutase
MQYWKEEDIFKRSIRNRSANEGDLLEGPKGNKEEVFSFYDGPPFATGLPHYGHILAGTIKDVIPRYQTMRGKKVERRFGWDCHGLPIENLIEKEHDLKSKKDIEAMGVKAFNDLCRASVQRYVKEWRKSVERMGRWVDMDHDYRTMDPEYMESIWWVFKGLSDKKLIYEGHKPMHICPRCQTPLSNFEVTQGYKDITDQSAYVKFALKDEPNTFVLAWTTTPWTLPGNLFLAVGSKIHYVQVEFEGAQYILAESRLEHLFKNREHIVKGKVKASELVGKTYEPLFPYFVSKYRNAFKIVEGEFVTTEDGTGVVHIAPGFGEDDFEVGKREGAAMLQHVGMDGHFTKDVTDFAGQEVKPKDEPSKTDKEVIKWLKSKNKLFDQESYKHSYPHCWRCDTPLLNYATSSWFVQVENIKKDMLAANAKTEWVPEHLRDGRFGKWLEGARDWAISRNRYWGTPLPIWRTEDGSTMDVIGSRDDLMKNKLLRFTKVTVMRHGESEGNVSPVYQSNVPGTPLTKNGKKQAEAAAKIFEEDPVARIYASPLQRTQETAQAVAKVTEAEIVTDERIRETLFGEYEGKTIDFSDLALVRDKRAKKLAENSIESIYHFPGMESWEQVQSRTANFLKEILPRHRGQHIVIVTHADPFQNMKHFFTKEDPMKISHQPYPGFAIPHSFYWDHDTESAMDLHKESIDDITWQGSDSPHNVELTLVRHGQTDWNIDHRIQSAPANPPLNDTGRAQAAETAGMLKKEQFDVIVASDLERTKETAEIIRKELGNIPLEFTELLRERDFGKKASGMTVPDYLKKHPWSFESLDIAMHEGNPYDGESLSGFLKRIESVQEMLLKKYAGKKVLVVTHGGVVQAMHGIVLNMDHRGAVMSAPKNAEIKKLTLKPLMKRIPEVLDCWFESGSMPYAQSHFPFSHASGPVERKKKDLPPGFPANFIAEGIDQTRGWFYTLTVLSAALFKQPSFMNCIVNGTVLAEDGKKMSKRLKNYPEPLEIVEKHGADAVRFALMSSPAVRAEDLRFSEKIVEEALRSVLLPLWHSVGFFVTYANAAKFTPVSKPKAPTHPLDVWIKTEVQDLVNRMTDELERYNLSGTCGELKDTIDALTNWYIRLSRRRFAGKTEGVAVDESALQTLFDVLVTICQVIAPFCPFIADGIYLNLVGEKHGSVHLTDWPECRKLKPEEAKILTRTRMLRRIVSLGLSVRGDAKVRLRQPLGQATVAIPSALAHGGALTEDELQVLRQELNVKQLDVINDPGKLAEAILQIDARKVGPRVGGRVQELIQAGKAGSFEKQEDGSYKVLDAVIAPDEAQVIYRGKEGKNIAAEAGIVVAMDTEVTEELLLEGHARELIRAIQQARKESGLAFTDKIKLWVEAPSGLLEKFGSLITNETQATLSANEGEEQTVDLEGMKIAFRFQKI